MTLLTKPLTITLGSALLVLVIEHNAMGQSASSVGSMSLAQSTPPQGCTSAEHHEFDFWVGDWDVFDDDDPHKIVARLKVDRILDGCVLREDYQQTDGLAGQSFSVYDSSRKVWHQTWATNRGYLLLLDSKLKGSEMILSGMDHMADGKERLVRGVWKPQSDGFHEFAERSLDGGKRWSSWFSMTFKSHKP